ncbi:uncharacterized protein BXZ73DRAFT_74410 [Epithele typhae]|uniref:uncharacterized protein n=1 Tax=Epithele typhae TaxID=378194 RepID=UPI002007AB3F|nr:uncharacterized protein BXZ73DRAFT_74410 [Epithele typhae]KAH9943470.1 hypothetical protein BXZ73DRAFT_74410 [Epithele typhae]
MMAWACVVAERLGFSREEALSVASVYTEMNAITRGVTLGLYADGKQKGMEASRTGNQPYVELMGRREPPFFTPPYGVLRSSPLFLRSAAALDAQMATRNLALLSDSAIQHTADGHWRALGPTGGPAPPAAAFSYISRALRQTRPAILGALRLLAASLSPRSSTRVAGTSTATSGPPGGLGRARGSPVRDDPRPAQWGRGPGGDGAASEARRAHGNEFVKRDPGSRTISGGSSAGRTSTPPLSEEPGRGDEPELKRVRADVQAGEGQGPENGPASGPRPVPVRDEFDAALDDDALFDEFDLSAIP